MQLSADVTTFLQILLLFSRRVLILKKFIQVATVGKRSQMIILISMKQKFGFIKRVDKG